MVDIHENTHITMSLAEINRWSNDDQAIATLLDAHWIRFFDEPKYANRQGKQSRAHRKYTEGLSRLQAAMKHLRNEHGPRRYSVA